MDLYAENILDHYRHPRHAEHLQAPTVTREEVNLSCGDSLTVELELKGRKVAAVGWSGTGCAISQAAMSMLSEELTGMSENEIETMKPQTIYDLLGVPVGPRRFKCALLCLHTLKNALLVANRKPAQSWVETVAVPDED